VKEQASTFLRLQWSYEQINEKLPVSYESIVLHVYTRRMAATCGRTCAARRKRKSATPAVLPQGTYPHRRPLSERPAQIDKRFQV